jgi:hypothetical protein
VLSLPSKAASILLFFLIVACASNRRDRAAGDTSGSTGAAPSSLSACFHVDVPTATWTAVTSTDGHLKLQLPNPKVVRSGTIDTWSIPGGTVGYRVAADNGKWRDSVRADKAASHAHWCEEVIADAPVLIHRGYSANAPTGAGYYVTAYWPIVSDSAAHLVTFHEDSTKQGELLAIVRSASRPH